MPAPMGRARLVLREKVIDEEGNITEVAIWAVPGRRSGPERIRYRLAFVRQGEQTPAVLYDNHHPKGHHRHIEGTEKPYVFVDVDRLITDFTDDVRRLKGDARWPRR